MKKRQMLSQRFFVVIAFISAVSIGLIYPINNMLRVEKGTRWAVFTEDFAWGVLYSLLIWLFNIYGFGWLVRRFRVLLRWQEGLIFTTRILLSIAFGIMLVYINEKFNILHVELPGYWSHELANEVRGGITTGTILLLYQLLITVGKMQQISLENERLLSANATAQFESLKQQINPHFLFNSLNILKTMVRARDPNSEEYVLRLAEFYRSILLNRDKEVASLQEELNLLNHYIYMLKARFENKIYFDIRIKEDLKNSILPPLTLQLLVENCIKHNIVSAEYPLKITICNEKNWLLVQNNIQEKRTKEKSTNLGLDNINKRYELIGQQSIEVERDAHFFRVRLPILKTENFKQ